MIKFISDSSSDMLKTDDYTPVPLTISTEERTFIDNEDLNINEMLDYLASYNNRSYTACPSTQSWLEAFEGGDEIYVTTLTGKISGTYNSALVAKNIYLESNPQAKVLVFDSLSTGGQLRMAMEKIMEWKKEGKTFEFIEENIASYNDGVRLLFAFKSLHNFAQNGRVSKVVASAIGVLGISVFGTATNGDIDPFGKCRGDKKVMSSIISDMKDHGYNNGKVYIAHIQNPELANKIKDRISEEFPESTITIYESRGLCAYYGERYGIIMSYEKH